MALNTHLQACERIGVGSELGMIQARSIVFSRAAASVVG